ncbi:TSL-kinase interacting protein 1 [Vitis vinifera]|uniref:TSL-kinase interacting protein 1 n=1 Tax=Vitis vinifera TaxID=29760 RepID=A0A438D3V7_VITVI|nr:TSL-kinase interacting protein 1 [Vitis vinifera]
MQTEAQVSLDCQAVPHPENNVIKDGDPGALPSSPNHVAPKPGWKAYLCPKLQSQSLQTCWDLTLSLHVGCKAFRPERYMVMLGAFPAMTRNIRRGLAQVVKGGEGLWEVLVKRQTRQWAAWTRQEEESFFTALRQNFEKITCRVQSKNKDQVTFFLISPCDLQVRHYYYRLVRRMNKLLGPGFSLDAKNSKDTNAAMLRW